MYTRPHFNVENGFQSLIMQYAVLLLELTKEIALKNVLLPGYRVGYNGGVLHR